MKVDMSPQAVTSRLKLLDQLWELSVKLMAAKRHDEQKTRNSETELLSERSLAEDWNKPQEDEAWQHLSKLPSR
jgi:hypothetical protein